MRVRGRRLVDRQRQRGRGVEFGGRHRLAVDGPAEALVVDALVGGVAVDHEELVVGLGEDVEVAERSDRVGVRERRRALALLAADRLKRLVESGVDLGSAPEVSAGERVGDHRRDGVGHRVGITESDLPLCRVNVRVDAAGRQRHVDDRHGLASGWEQPTVPLTDRGGEAVVPDRPPVHRHPDVIPRGARHRRVRQRPGDGHRGLSASELGARPAAIAADVGARRERRRMTRGLAVVHAQQRFGDPRARRRQRLRAVVCKRERHCRVREGVVRDELGDPGELRRGPRERLPARRPAREEVFHDDRGAAGASGVRDRRRARLGVGCRLVDGHPRPDRAAVVGDEFEPGGLGDGGQRLAAEAERVDADRVAVGGELARRVALHGEAGVSATHPAAVVCHPDPVRPVAVDRDLDPRSPGVERVVEQFAHDAGRPGHHLAGRDAVDGGRLEPTDGSRRVPSPGPVPVVTRHR